MLLLNWYLFIGVEVNLGRAHETRFSYLGCSGNFPTSNPVTFIGEYPPSPGSIGQDLLQNRILKLVVCRSFNKNAQHELLSFTPQV